MKKIKSLSLSLAIIMAAGLCTPCSGMSIFRKKKIKKPPVQFNWKKISPKKMAQSCAYQTLAHGALYSGICLSIFSIKLYDRISGRTKGIQEEMEKDPKYKKRLKNASILKRIKKQIQNIKIWWKSSKKYDAAQPSSHYRKLTYLPILISLPITYICFKKGYNASKEGLSPAMEV